MTLKTFKNQLAVSLIIVSFILYSFGLFIGGRISQRFSLNYFKKAKIQNKIVQPIQTNLPYSDNQSSNVISSYVKLCSNTFYSFEVSYPKDWFTTYNSEGQKCTYFAPYSFVIPQNLDLPFVPIQIEVIPSAKWLETVKFHQNPNDFQNVLSSQNMQINDKSAVLVKAETTGNGSMQKGLVISSYLIFNSSNPVILSYHQTDQKENTKLYEDILAQMANTLNFF
ncbi:hypothetical protein A3D81_02040 [Candidatus Curtissbacteria bacterium RIFCSPHIGHO2_02_FULL_40_17]|uniref:PsbP C-terminal domain-containing protein n=4 Tax=Candidatus Curtissiibacteriota TaxID=1752717 RepID=A0A1F5GGR4_9BACT|nr:MAG: hypothetical protein A2693_03495 [Candidatus Curtissbacteria bacterium RIFCSPHIGHO2_01_FULL_40_12]OGD91071.1 MAG: hypothetical protein A3D81_02040 [Candidatus Curtissbacteria bacterium RIFCSPHIGHO2_02_FULL_40_17]OGE05481.1 MAG: hypothetical protein A3F45_03830 [Candidatus Curtissbacteria bacterium RIFCSPHIGHO2_12_FULL_41_17]OGE07117.1 MAG: hypothetical protein A3I53_02870 [Candidatus Curtissbacteria bacterium RIFCSPLOWO2_02_FULL_40_13b]